MNSDFEAVQQDNKYGNMFELRPNIKTYRKDKQPLRLQMKFNNIFLFNIKCKFITNIWKQRLFFHDIIIKQKQLKFFKSNIMNDTKADVICDNLLVI